MTRPARTLGELAQLVGGRANGPADTMVHGAAPLDEVAERQVTFVDQAERLVQAAASPAAAVLVPGGAVLDGKPTIEVADVYAAFAQVVEVFRPRRRESRPEIAPTAHISPTAQLGAGVSVGPGATIADDVTIGSNTVIHAGVHVMSGCQIGANVVVYPAAVLYEDTVVGDRSIIHAGVVLGAFGFGYRQQDERHELSAQLGYVELSSDVEVGANSTIDRGTYGATRIGEGTKIDNLVQVAHNCQIGRHNLLCAQVGIAGSTTTGDHVVMAGQVGVRDHVHIGTGARIGAMAGVSNDIPPGVSAFGAPATPERQQKILLASLAKLPEMRKEFKQVRQALRELQAAQRQTPSSSDAVIDPAA